MKIKYLIPTLLLFNLLIFNSLAQKEVRIISSDYTFLQETPKKKLPKKAKSIDYLYRFTENFVRYYQSNGYLTFSLDTIIEKEECFELLVFPGEKYGSTSISVPEEELLLIREANCNNFLVNNKLELSNWAPFSQKLISKFENSGFPFTEVYLDSIIIDKDAISGNLHIDKKQYITFDSIILKGDLKLSQSYLYPYLGLRKKKAYNESTIVQIPEKLAALPFATEFMPAGVEFVDNKAYLYLFLNKVKRNYFDGFIGLVPVDENSGKVSLNGELKISLNNILTLGESISLHWSSPGRYSQYLNINLDFPYLLWTPFGVAFDFTLDKTDTSYLNMNYNVGLQYSFRGANYIKIFFDYTSSNILSPELLIGDHNDITHLDYRKPMYGIEFMFRKLDNLHIPKKGFYFRINASAGKQTIIKNSKADESIYDNMTMSSAKYKIVGNIKGFIPLHPRWIVVLGANGGSLFGGEALGNELFKFGGINTLQGFDENSLEASNYLSGLTELRFIFTGKSYLHAFFNAAWYERKIPASYVHDFPFGFGVGIAFDTKAGIFSLSYALGKQFDNPISFKSGKIHLGIGLNF